MANVMDSTISVDQRSIEITASIAYRRNLDAVDGGNQTQSAYDEFMGFSPSRNLQSIDPGFSFQFRITDMKNQISKRPSDSSIEYYVYSSSGVLFEEVLSGMDMVNTEAGELDTILNGILPGDFRTDFEANYTLTVEFAQFEKSMYFILYLPPEIDFGEENPACTTLSGVDVPVLTCSADRTAKSLKFTDALKYAQSNPGKIEILIDKLRNPLENIVTSSFKIDSFTYDGYEIDSLTSDVTVNFFCEYPCAECDPDNPSRCEECY